LIVPDAIDTIFLRNFRELILRKVKQGLSFYIITGGGKLARNYQDAARAARGDLPVEDVDWLGIHSTRLNAQLMRTLFMEEAQARIVKNPTRGIHANRSILIGAGWKPGRSTDYCAVMAARKLGAHKLVNLSNIDYVYDSNPKDNPNASPLPKVGWEEFRKLIPTEWDPGLSSPFDPVAAREAHEHHLEVAVINGGNLSEFEKYLDGESFTGTVIS
jgi:uridylate kinase